MIDLEAFLKLYTKSVNRVFGGRVRFLGLQGSYGRGEATDESDIDVVLILDRCDADDIKAYRDLLDTLPHRELICGFVSGKDELLCWEKSDLFQFYYDTAPLQGTLAPLLEKIDAEAVRRAVRIGACNLCHACTHNLVHERSEDILRSLYKSARFVVQAVVFDRTGAYARTRSQLAAAAQPPERDVLETAQKLKNGEAVGFEAASELLLQWTKQLIKEYQE